MPFVSGFPPAPGFPATWTSLRFSTRPLCFRPPGPCQLLTVPGSALLPCERPDEAFLPSREDVWTRSGDPSFDLGARVFVFPSWTQTGPMLPLYLRAQPGPWHRVAFHVILSQAQLPGGAIFPYLIPERFPKSAYPCVLFFFKLCCGAGQRGDREPRRVSDFACGAVVRSGSVRVCRGSHTWLSGGKAFHRQAR